MSLTALALVCTLKPSPARSSSELMARQIVDALGAHDVTGQIIRIVDHDVKPGVDHDMGDGDAWPAIREQVLAADILLLSTPIWMGHPSSIAQRVLERLDADITETGDDGNPILYNKVGIAAIVGNEDGAHHSTAEIYQGLADVGFTIPAGGASYWNDVAMGDRDYQDLPETPEKVRQTIDALARNAAHLAKLLRGSAYPTE